MRKNPNEPMEIWIERVRKYELDYALKQVARGQDINVVMEAMSARIQQKILHPIFIALKESPDKKSN